MEILTSPRNSLLKETRKAAARGALTDQGLAVAEGFHLLDEALRSGCEVPHVFTNQAASGAVEGRVKWKEETRVAVLADDVFAGIATTEASQGVVSLVRPPVWTMDGLFDRIAPLLVMDGIQDPGNAGTMIRAAEAFGATGVVMLKGCVNPFNPKALRAAAGSAFRVPLVTGIDAEGLLAALDERGVALFSLAATGTLVVGEMTWGWPCAVVVGSEGRGVGELLRSRSTAIRIPTLTVESLNAATASAIVLYESFRQRRAAGE